MSDKNVTIDDCTGSGDVLLRKVEVKDGKFEGYNLSLESSDTIFHSKKALYDLLNGSVLKRVKVRETSCRNIIG